jgi:hypothetical protein
MRTALPAVGANGFRGIDSKLRVGDLVALRVCDVAASQPAELVEVWEPRMM